MKRLYILIVTIPMLFFCSIQGYAQPKECPVLSQLEKTSIKDKKEVIKALNTLIPKTYGTGIDDWIVYWSSRRRNLNTFMTYVLKHLK
ncbi:hypothetical protein AB1L16_27060 [Peribacillus frigoritolerans]|uniref:hypothetical protein n=1 Tax=Peribacillus frigoritolerans TaxID=450367 RepID=UPI0039A33996